MSIRVIALVMTLIATIAACARPTSTTQSHAEMVRAPNVTTTPAPTRAVRLPVVANAVAALGAWQKRMPLLQARQEIAAAEIGGKVYVVGGFGADRSTLGSAERYDPVTDAWDVLPTMPISLHHPMAAALNGRLYVFGGYLGIDFQPSVATLEYDPMHFEWTRKADMLAPRGAGAAVSIGSKIYVVGGERFGASVGELTTYDPATDTWAALKPMPTPRNHIGATALQGKLYVSGGRDTTSGTLATFEVYDPKTDVWQTIPPMPTGRSGHSAAVARNCFYAIGGEGSTRPNGTFDENEMFDPRTGKWATAAMMPVGKHGIGAVTVGERIFVPAGADLAGFGAVATHDVFTPARSCL